MMYYITSRHIYIYRLSELNLTMCGYRLFGVPHSPPSDRVLKIQCPKLQLLSLNHNHMAGDDTLSQVFRDCTSLVHVDLANAFTLLHSPILRSASLQSMFLNGCDIVFADPPPDDIDESAVQGIAFICNGICNCICI